jgi:hypothetical protein
VQCIYARNNGIGIVLDYLIENIGREVSRLNAKRQAAYSNYSCEQLAQEMIKEQTTLSAVSKQQHDAATGDAFGVFLIGVPMSSTFGGDKEGQVSLAKGKVQAIQAAMMSKGCNAPPVLAKPAPAPKKG